jgi:hypothetical protein
VTADEPRGSSASRFDAGHGVLSDRARAIERLIRRYAPPGCRTLGAIAAILDSAAWLSEGDVAIVDALAGKVPVSWGTDESVAVIRLARGQGALYVTLAGRFDAGEVCAALTGSANDLRDASDLVRDAAWNGGS